MSSKLNPRTDTGDRKIMAPKHPEILKRAVAAVQASHTAATSFNIWCSKTRALFTCGKLSIPPPGSCNFPFSILRPSQVSKIRCSLWSKRKARIFSLEGTTAFPRMSCANSPVRRSVPGDPWCVPEAKLANYTADVAQNYFSRPRAHIESPNPDACPAQSLTFCSCRYRARFSGIRRGGRGSGSVVKKRNSVGPHLC